MGRGVLALLSGAARALPTAYNVYQTGQERDIRRGALQAQAAQGDEGQMVQVGSNTIDPPPGVGAQALATTPMKRDFSNMGLTELSQLATTNQMKKADSFRDRQLGVLENRADYKSPASAAQRQYHATTSILDMLRRRMRGVQDQLRTNPNNEAMKKLYLKMSEQYEKLDMEAEKYLSMMTGGQDPFMQGIEIPGQPADPTSLMNME